MELVKNIIEVVALLGIIFRFATDTRFHQGTRDIERKQLDIDKKITDILDRIIPKG